MILGPGNEEDDEVPEDFDVFWNEDEFMSDDELKALRNAASVLEDDDDSWIGQEP